MPKTVMMKVMIMTLLLATLALVSAIQGNLLARERKVQSDDVVPDAALRAQLRPTGDFRDLVQRLSDRLMRDPPEDDQCKTASELGFVFWWMTDRERQSIDDHMLNILIEMLTRDSNDDDKKCVIRTAATVLGHIGPRARSALPALKAELTVLEVDADFQRAKKSRADANPMLAEGSLDFVFQSAIESIETVKMR